MLPSCRSCSVPESACGTICGAWRPTTRSRRKRQGAAPSTLPSNVSWPMTSGDHGLLHMVHDGFPVSVLGQCPLFWFQNQNQTVRSRSEEHTSELQSLMRISYAVFCLNKKNTIRHIIQSLHRLHDTTPNPT